jgi:hypothetical protein
MVEDKRTCLVVLGMHRSGTSALGGALECVGVSMGRHPLSPTADNPKGFYENAHICDLHDQSIMKGLKTSWDAVLPLPVNCEANAIFTEFLPSAQKIVLEDYAFLNIFGIKDPRMCLLYPFWKKALEDLGIAVFVILPYRNPMEVAYSLQRRNGFSLEKGLLLWAQHVLFAEFYSRENRRVFSGYDALLQNPLETLSRIEKRLRVTFPRTPVQVRDKIVAMLPQELRHHEVALDNVSKDLPDFIIDVAYAYQALASDEIEDDTEIRARFDEWRMTYDRLSRVFYNESVRKELHVSMETINENENLKSELAGIRWRGAQLFIDTGNGFSEAQSIILPYIGQGDFSFWLSEYGRFHRLRFHPINDSVVLRLSGLELTTDADRTVELQAAGSNATIKLEDLYYFTTNGPQIMFDLAGITGSSFQSARIRVEFLETGQSAVRAAVDAITADYRRQFAAKDAELRHQAEALVAKDAELRHQAEALVAKDAELGQRESERAGMLNSVSWRITAPLRRLGWLKSTPLWTSFK